jgi:hypothetical protein
MIKKRKWRDWIIFEDEDTGEKMFTLPESKTKVLPVFWIEKEDEKQNPEHVPGRVGPEPHFEDRSGSGDKQGTKRQ